VVLYAVDDHSGPLAFMFTGENEFLEEILEEVHEFFSNFSVALIIFHVSGVIIAGKQHNENLVKAMISGKKKRTIEPEKD
jgi:cytochrome b